MIEKAVKKILGVEDAPKWLEREVFKKMEESGFDIQSAVSYLAPVIEAVYKSNLEKYRPGGASIRKAAAFLTAELLERWGYRVEFVELFGATLPAAVRGNGLYTPAVPIFDSKRKSLYLASKSRKYMRNVIQITTNPNAEGILAEVIKIQKPPFYYLYTSANIQRLVEESVPMAATVNKKYGNLYYYWRHFRERGFLVLVGREVAGVAVDILAIGLGKYAIVANAGGKKISRLRRVVDAVYLV
ncbi:MAG: hypothetical protein QW434_05235 [Pyrobaculum sp.]